MTNRVIHSPVEGDAFTRKSVTPKHERVTKGDAWVTDLDTLRHPLKGQVVAYFPPKGDEGDGLCETYTYEIRESTRAISKSKHPENATAITDAQSPSPSSPSQPRDGDIHRDADHDC